MIYSTIATDPENIKRFAEVRHRAELILAARLIPHHRNVVYNGGRGMKKIKQKINKVAQVIIFRNWQLEGFCINPLCLC